MYSDYFGIKESAFSITPDPRFLFRSERHCEALAHLLYGMVESGCFVLLTGEVGTGKTTICRTLLEQLPENVDVALLLNPPQSGQELLLAITDELHVFVNHRDGTVQELVYLLTRRLLENHAQGRRTVVIIDEAQNIAPDVLEQVRLLTNLETHTEKLLHVILVGQPELRDLLVKPSLRQVTQRITARYHLEPLSAEETRDYIYHRLSVAGCRHGLFNEGALRAIFRESGGIPRVINILCDRALLGAFASDKPHVTAKLIHQAARQWRGERKQRRFWTKNRFAALAATGLLGAAAMVYAYVGDFRYIGLIENVRAAQIPLIADTSKAGSAKQVPASAISATTASVTAQKIKPGDVKSIPSAVTPEPAHLLAPKPAGNDTITQDNSAQPNPDEEAGQEDASTAEARPLPDGIHSIGPGSPPHAVRWLRRELDRIEGTVSDENSPLFDEQLRARVKVLQRNNGLVADGIAGPHTLNYMHVIYGTSLSRDDSPQDISQPRT